MGWNTQLEEDRPVRECIKKGIRFTGGDGKVYEVLERKGLVAFVKNEIGQVFKMTWAPCRHFWFFKEDKKFVYDKDGYILGFGNIDSIIKE